MIKAYKNFFKGFLDFTGRSTRSDFWWVWLMNNVFCIPLYIIYFQMILNDGKEVDPISGVAILSLYIILFMVLFIPSLALKVRRLRDAGIHWAFIFLYFVPMGGIALLVLLATPTKEVEIVTIDRSKELEAEEVSPFE